MLLHYLGKNQLLLLSISDIFSGSMWVVLKKSQFGGAEVRIQTWKWTLQMLQATSIGSQHGASAHMAHVIQVAASELSRVH